MIRHVEYSRARFTKLAPRLWDAVYERLPLESLEVAGPVGRISLTDARALAYAEPELPRSFGPLWATYWFRGEGRVPAAWAGRRVDLLWDTTCEGTLWLDGKVTQGLNRHHGQAPLTREAVGGERIGFEVELACNGLFGRQDLFELRSTAVGAFDAAAWSVYHDFEALRELEAAEGLDPALAGRLRTTLDGFCDLWPDPSAAALLTGALENRNGTVAHELAAIGHAHIDTAWLWPLAESHRKVARTFSSAVRAMEDYPEYRFAASQAIQYAWIKERDPDLWERVLARVRSGQIVPVGGCWVEPDCNLPSGEALVRQLTHGIRWFEQELGVRCRELWSPDAFGYTAQLPQILNEVGITRFLTQKLSWNRFNKPEHHTFVWEGPDGSRVLAHFPPADTYSSDVSVADLRRSAAAFKDHEHSGQSMLLFGHGDGGGGPTRGMLERLRRVRDLQGLPRTEIVAPETFFERLEAEPEPRPVVVGELYFEYHRGVYTTQARTKRLNRRCEQALHDAEFLCCARGDSYPADELDRLWKQLLLDQFHDILPGSSITLVSEEAERDLAAVLEGAEALCARGETAVNTTGVARVDVVEAPSGELVALAAPPYGQALPAEDNDEVGVEGLVLENRYLRVELLPDGTVLSLVDLQTGRETLAAPGNRLELYDDRPVEFDAWDIDPAHLATMREVAPAASYSVTSSPLRAEVTFERHVGEASRLTQVVRLDAGSRRLEIHTTASWHESHMLLKVCFPLAVRSPTATYETAFGATERPTHRSTSLDSARYEVPGHRFADLSEHGFGAAVLTDSKYGYSCFRNELRVSLLRAPKSPDPEADMGEHAFAYALLPHAGTWRDAGVLAEAIAFNAPLRWTNWSSGDGSFAACDDDGVLLDTIKSAEDGDGIILRLYETRGGRGTARVRLAAGAAGALRTNALEEGGSPLGIEDGAIVVPYRPHEIVTIRVS